MRDLTRSPLSRRAVLRGLGTAVALPWLEAMTPSRAPLPRRLAYVYVPNGIHMPDWNVAEEGALDELPWILEPLAPWKSELQQLSGLAHDKGRANGDGPGDHARAGATFLTGVQPYKPDGEVRLGISADQVAANAVGQRTRFRSLELGCEPGRTNGQCDSGYACAYSGHISWHGPTTPAAKEVDPRVVFDRLFRGGSSAEAAAAQRARIARRRSVLDFVREDVARLEDALGAEDRHRIDEFESGLRELERRLERDEPEYVEAVPDDARPGARSRALGEHARALMDLIALAFQTDSTRIVTLMVCDEGSNRPYRNLAITDGHHTLSHHAGDAAKQEKIRAINRYHIELFGHLLGRLSAAREGDRSLLDMSMVVYGSGLADGNRHAHHDLPLLLCGRGGGTLSPGRHVRYPRDTPLNDLHLALLERMEAPTDALGDSTGVLAGI